MADWFSDVSRRIVDLLDGVDPALLVLFTGLFTALETTALIGLIVPGEVVVVVAAAAAATPLVFVLVLAAATLGTFVGQLGGYALGRILGPRLRPTRFGRLLGAQYWDQVAAYLAGRGSWILVPVRFAVVLHTLVPIAAGVVRMPLPKFALWSAISSFLWSAVFAVLGAVAGTALRNGGVLGFWLSVAIFLAVTLGVLWHARQTLPRRDDVSRLEPTRDTRKGSTT